MSYAEQNERNACLKEKLGKSNTAATVKIAAQVLVQVIQHDRDRTEAANLCAQTYPTQRRFILAYVVDTYAALDCAMKPSKHWVNAPEDGHLPKHRQLKYSHFCGRGLVSPALGLLMGLTIFEPCV